MLKDTFTTSTEFALVKEIVNLDVNIKIPLWTFLKEGWGVE